MIALGADETQADEEMAELRRRDAERFVLETNGGIFAGRALVLGNIDYVPPPPPEPADQAQP